MRVDPLESLKSGAAQFWTLLVGVNTCHDSRLSPLNYAAADSQGLADALDRATSEFPRREQVILHDHPPVEGEAPLAGHSPTLERILQRLRHITTHAKKLDTILFHFSGHGKVDESSQDLYLCVADTDLEELSNTALSLRMVQDLLKRSLASNIVIILDACRNSSIIARGEGLVLLSRSSPGEESGDEDEPEFRSTLQGVVESYRSKHQEVCTVYSCMDGHQAWELAGRIKHGAFTYCLIQGLAGQAVDRSDRISVDSLFRYVREETERLTSHWNRSQVPGCHRFPQHHDIILGIPTKDIFAPSSIPPSQLSMSERKDHYDRVFYQCFRKEYPAIQAATRQKLDQLAREYSIPRVAVRELESHYFNSYQETVEHHQQDLKRRLYQAGGMSPGELAQLRHQTGLNRLGLDGAVLDQLDADLIAQFQQHQEEYRRLYTDALYLYGRLKPADIERLDQCRLHLGLGEAVVSQIAETQGAQFQRDQASYQQACLEVYRQSGHPLPREANLQLRQLRSTLKLGESVAQGAEREALRRFQQDEQEYGLILARQIYQTGTVDRAVLAHHQIELALGNSVVQRLEQQVRETVARDQSTYEVAYKADLYEDGQINESTLQSLQGQLNLGDPVVRAIAPAIQQQFQQDQRNYQQTYAANLRRDGQVETAGLERLQQRLSLGQPVVDAIVVEELAQFEADQQQYVTAVAAHLRQQGQPDSPALQDLKAQLQLGDRVVQTLVDQAIAQFKLDQQAYWEHYVEARRQEPTRFSPGTRARLAQVRESLGQISEAVADAIVKDYSQRSHNYKTAFTEILYQYDGGDRPRSALSSAERARLEHQRQSLDLNPLSVERIEDDIFQEYQQKLLSYSEAFQQFAQAHYPLNPEDRQSLEELRQSLGIRPPVARRIEDRLAQEWGLVPPELLPSRFPRWWMRRRVIGVGSLVVMGGAIAMILTLNPLKIGWPEASPSPPVAEVREAILTSLLPQGERHWIDLVMQEANQLADQDQFINAIQRIQAIAPLHRDEVQPRIDQWAEEIRQRATQTYERGQLTEAIAMLQAIAALKGVSSPPNSTFLSQVEDSILQWTQEQNTLAQLNTLADNEEWTELTELAQTLEGVPYWDAKVAPLLRLIPRPVESPSPAPSGSSPSNPGSSSDGGTGSPTPHSSEPTPESTAPPITSDPV